LSDDEVLDVANATALDKLVAGLSVNSNLGAVKPLRGVEGSDHGERSTSRLGEVLKNKSRAEIPWTCDSDDDIFKKRPSTIPGIHEASLSPGFLAMAIMTKATYRSTRDLCFRKVPLRLPLPICPMAQAFRPYR
jgi:hypothetical protein